MSNEFPGGERADGAEPMGPNPNDVVGHKTLADGSHLPLYRWEGELLRAQVESDERRREALMPTEQDAINIMFDAWVRLKSLGWREAIYCPKDGTSFFAIEPGSTGQHRCHYSGEWPTGHWTDGDCSIRACLIKLDPEDEAKRLAMMKAASEAFKAKSGKV